MHKITQWGEYGIHIMLYIASKESSGERIVSALDISNSQNISLNYTQQILMKLRKGGLIESERGPKGGFHLSKSPEEISLKDILEISEGATAEVICEAHPIDYNSCSGETNCYLRSVWYGLKGVINDYLEKITVYELLHNQDNRNAVSLVKLPSPLETYKS